MIAQYTKRRNSYYVCLKKMVSGSFTQLEINSKKYLNGQQYYVFNRIDEMLFVTFKQKKNSFLCFFLLSITIPRII